MELKKIKSVLAAIVVIIIVIVFARETGWVDLSFYRMRSNSSFSTSVSKKNITAPISYNLKLTHHGDPVLSLGAIANGRAPMGLSGSLNTNFKGLYYLPLYKNFSMEYESQIANDSADDAQIEISLHGKITARIIGPCSARKARELLLEKAKESIQKQAQKQLSQS